MTKTTAWETFTWAIVSVAIAYLALALGSTITPDKEPVLKLIAGLLGLAASGAVCSYIVKMFASAIRGTQKKERSKDDPSMHGWGPY
ncbi:MAG: hypothetical protein WC444_02000 [Candidatus Paceibacterota bacterium]